MPETTGGTGRKSINFSFSFTSILAFFFLVIAAMTAAYIWGVMTGRSQATSPDYKASVQDTAVQAVQAKGEILQAHELEFTQALRGEAPRPKIQEEPPGKESGPVKPVTQTDKPIEPASPAASSVEPAGISETPPQANTEINDYVFQVAALKDEHAVDSLREKLEGKGMRTRMEKSGKLYMVYVFMRGESGRVSELEQIAHELRLGEPLLRSKKAASQ